MTYEQFLDQKTQLGGNSGFEPVFMPDFLFPFQKHLCEWAIRKGRAAIFADCGLGKTAMQLVWAQNVVEKTNGRVLILTPLAVGSQAVKEGQKFGIECYQSRDGKFPPSAKIIITNYQQLGKFDWKDFQGVVCDESSILKNFDGEIKKQVTDFMRKIAHRLLCTATAAPNDYIELGTSSEALGVMRRVEMMAQYFNHDGGDTSKWRLKKHAAKHLFWRWICTWARALRKPSDLGFNEAGYDLPALKVNQHVVDAVTKNTEYLFDMPAIGLDEQRDERRRTLNERCEMAARLVSGHDVSISWCHLNCEGDLLEKLIPNSIQVSGQTSDEDQELIFSWFCGHKCLCEIPRFRVKFAILDLENLQTAQSESRKHGCVCGHTSGIRRLIGKPQQMGFGLNFQHCAHQTFFPSHSFEQWYQAIRRCWRFGQKRDVVIDVITSEGEANVVKNMMRKSDAADEMFSKLVALVGNELKLEAKKQPTTKPVTPSWL